MLFEASGESDARGEIPGRPCVRCENRAVACPPCSPRILHPPVDGPHQVMTDGPHAQWERAITSAPPARFQRLTDGPALAAGVWGGWAGI